MSKVFQSSFVARQKNVEIIVFEKRNFWATETRQKDRRQGDLPSVFNEFFIVWEKD